MRDDFLHDSLPYDLSVTARLPGMAPVAPGEWLHVDGRYAAQMAEREQLIATRRETVLACRPEAEASAQELLQIVLAELIAHHGFQRVGEAVSCPDGRRVALDWDDPLATVGKLAQEDFCILQKSGDQHVLTGGILCFPALWLLSEKLGRPLTAIHAPVPVYDAELARRVQRLFDGVRVGHPLWRANQLRYAAPDLHQPRSEQYYSEGKGPETSKPYLRSERQCLLRLPETQAVVFSIHTYVMHARIAAH